MKVETNVTKEKKKREQMYRKPALRKGGVIIAIEGITIATNLKTRRNGEAYIGVL